MLLSGASLTASAGAKIASAIEVPEIKSGRFGQNFFNRAYNQGASQSNLSKRGRIPISFGFDDVLIVFSKVRCSVVSSTLNGLSQNPSRKPYNEQSHEPDAAYSAVLLLLLEVFSPTRQT